MRQSPDHGTVNVVLVVVVVVGGDYFPFRIIFSAVKQSSDTSKNHSELNSDDKLNIKIFKSCLLAFHKKHEKNYFFLKKK